MLHVLQHLIGLALLSSRCAAARSSVASHFESSTLHPSAIRPHVGTSSLISLAPPSDERENLVLASSASKELELRAPWISFNLAYCASRPATEQAECVRRSEECHTTAEEEDDEMCAERSQTAGRRATRRNRDRPKQPQHAKPTQENDKTRSRRSQVIWCRPLGCTSPH